VSGAPWAPRLLALARLLAQAGVPLAIAFYLFWRFDQRMQDLTAALWALTSATFAAAGR